MKTTNRTGVILRSVLFALVILGPPTVNAQKPQATELSNSVQRADRPSGPAAMVSPSDKKVVKTVLPRYHDQNEGLSLVEIHKLAVEKNRAIKIARLELEGARARLRQARLFQNPSLEIEQSSGRFVRSGGEGEFSIGFALPIDVYNQRRKRINLARAEIALREVEVDAKIREISKQIITIYSEALATLRELSVLEDLLELDTQTARFVQIRVNEGESAPLELRLLQTEIERLRARHSLVEGRMQAAVSRLKFYVGFTYQEPLKLREQLDSAVLPPMPTNLDTAYSLALRSRPELRVAELELALATAGLRLIRAQGRPDFTVYSRYSRSRGGFDDPRGSFAQRDRLLTFGVAIGLPLFDRQQGAKAEAEVAIRMARQRIEFAKQIIRNEVATAFRLISATKSAELRLETNVLPDSRQNVETVRKVYAIGELKITDLINEQRRLLDANRDLTEVLAERYRANADLLIALGISFL